MVDGQGGTEDVGVKAGLYGEAWRMEGSTPLTTTPHKGKLLWQQETALALKLA